MLSSETKSHDFSLQGAPAARLALDNIAVNVSGAHTNNRFALRNSLRSISSIPRVCRCGLELQWNAAFVQLVRDARGYARFSGLETCRRVWLCPVCAQRIAWKRGRELEEQIRLWLETGGTVLFQTLTFPHDYSDPLKESAKAAAKAFTAVLSGRRWQDEKSRYGIEGTVRTLEITLGPSGWHPHLHALIFLRRPRGVRARRAIQRNCFERFSKVIERAGYRAPDLRNCPIEIVHSAEVGQYVTKFSGVARELTGWHMKKARGESRTPMQLLRDVVANNTPEDRRRWNEWETGTHRRRQLTYSRGLRKRLTREEEIDPDIQAELEIERALGNQSLIITQSLWRKIAALPGLDVCLRNAYAKGGHLGAFECLAIFLPDVDRDYLIANLIPLPQLGQAS